MDIDALRVENLKEALRQGNRYLVLGLFSSLFIFALSVDPAAFGSGNVSLFGGLPPLPVRYALIVLTLAYWVSPFLADFSLARAQRIGLQLQQGNLELLKAALTYPSIATTRVHGPRWIASLVPPILVSIAGWKTGFFAFEQFKFFLFLMAVIPYLTLLAFRLRQAIGGLKPDAHGD